MSLLFFLLGTSYLLFMNPGKMLLVLAGCYSSGCKAVINDGTSHGPYSHARVAGTDHYPQKVTAAIGKKKITKRSELKSFVNTYSYNHRMPQATLWTSPWTKLGTTKNNV